MISYSKLPLRALHDSELMSEICMWCSGEVEMCMRGRIHSIPYLGFTCFLARGFDEAGKSARWLVHINAPSTRQRFLTDIQGRDSLPSEYIHFLIAYGSYYSDIRCMLDVLTHQVSETIGRAITMRSWIGVVCYIGYRRQKVRS